jgi:hypothetical protein
MPAMMACDCSDRTSIMANPRTQALLTAAAMLLIAVFVLFLLPPAANDSEKAFRLIVAVAAIFAGAIKWRRVMRSGRDGIEQ